MTIVWRALTAAFILLAQPCAATDREVGAAPAAVAPWREVSVGGIASSASWVLYSSTTIAPLGSLDSDGVRLRLGSGYGRYSYDTLPAARGDCRYGFGDNLAHSIKGRVTFSDILAGYQLTLGATTIKAFGGLALDDQQLTPNDICNRANGRASGVKAVVETWTNLTPAIWLALDGNWTQANETHAGRARFGYRLGPKLSLGIEAAKFGNSGGDSTRGGLFARYEWAGGEVALSGGVSGERFEITAASRERTWAALTVMFRY